MAIEDEQDSNKAVEIFKKYYSTMMYAALYLSAVNELSDVEIAE